MPFLLHSGMQLFPNSIKNFSPDYLPGLPETKNHPDTDLHDLHLSDEMIDLLKSGKLNNRLLSEIALHKDFQRFLVDIAN